MYKSVAISATWVEIVSGVDKDDQIVVNPPDSLAGGQDVKIAKEEPAKTTAAQDGHTDKKSDTAKDDGKAKPNAKDIPPARGSTEPMAKASRAPDAPKSDKVGSGKTDQTGDQPASGQTMPGTDGNGAKMMPRGIVALPLLLAFTACSLAPDYREPSVGVPGAFKEGPVNK